MNADAERATQAVAAGFYATVAIVVMGAVEDASWVELSRASKACRQDFEAGCAIGWRLEPAIKALLADQLQRMLIEAVA